MKKTKYTYLSDSERSEIEILRNKGYSMRKIALTLERSPNTISYELKRCPSGYRAKYAKQYARTALKNRRLQRRKLNKDPRLRSYVLQGLENDWNPHEISGRLSMKEEMSVSATTIYLWLQTDVRGERYRKHLYMYRFKRKRSRKRGLHGKIKHMISIHERPDISHVPGHWETDLVVSSRSGRGALSTNNERISKYLVVNYVPDQTSRSKQKTLHRLEREFNVRSITFDRGHENARHHECSSKTYFCDPYSSYQRGQNENQNKLLRRYFPKGTDFSKVSSEELCTAVRRINNKPRKSLGYKTATEVAKEIGLFTGVS